ncbi:DUF4184 family protein [Leminorella grimontii]|uniref:DUF4184 family protein n=1 Tax=Leminorella grimontii TaxID=82981 RepID=UPI00321F8936
MPFTFAHPALVLPLRYGLGKRLSMTALIAGSVSPDLEYFVRMSVKGLYGHTPAGIFLLDIPLALLLTFTFHCVIRGPLIQNLPAFIRHRLWPLRLAISWPAYVKSHFAIVLLSLFIGALSHVIWDAFTHQDAFFITMFGWQTISFNLLNHEIPLYRILQHASTFIGLTAIAAYFYLTPKHAEKHSTISMRYWLTVSLVALLITAIRLIWIYPHIPFGTALVTAISALFIGLSFAPFLCGWAFKSSNERPRQLS